MEYGRKIWYGMKYGMKIFSMEWKKIASMEYGKLVSHFVPSHALLTTHVK